MLRKRQKESLVERIILHMVAMATDYADHEQVVRRTVFRRQGVTNVLTDCFHIRKNFLCHRVVNDREARGIPVFSFGLREVTTAPNASPDTPPLVCRAPRSNRTRAPTPGAP